MGVARRKKADSGKNTRSGLNRTVRLTMSINTPRPSRNIFTLLFRPSRRRVEIGTYFTVAPVRNIANVLVVENEKPSGIRCRYLRMVDDRKERKPELRSGILRSARRLANQPRMRLP